MNLLKTRLTLDDFILEMMRTPIRHLQIEQLQDWVARLDLKDDLFQQHISFCNQQYTRKLLCRTSRFDMLVIGWQPGQVSTIHDHGGSLNVTRIYSGSMTSRLFEVYDRPASTHSIVRLTQEEHLKKDDLAVVDCHEIHQLANTSEQNVVTLHVYARPLLDITVYCPDSGRTERVPVLYSLEDDFANE